MLFWEPKFFCKRPTAHTYMHIERERHTDIHTHTHTHIHTHTLTHTLTHSLTPTLYDFCQLKNNKKLWAVFGQNAIRIQYDICGYLLFTPSDTSSPLFDVQ